MKIQLPFIVFEITPRCNLSCQYCYNIWKRPGHITPKESSYGQAIKTLKRLFSIADVPVITMSGGEPTLFSRFKEVVLFLRMKQKDVTLISNGAAGLSDYAQLFKMGVNLFELPVHSPVEAVHDRMAGCAGAWKNSTESIKHILSIGGTVVSVVVITKLNYDHVPETMGFIKSLGVNQVMLNRFNIGGQGIKDKDNIGLSIDNMRMVFAQANKAVNRLDLLTSGNVCTPHCVLNPSDYPNIGFSACYPKQISGRPWTLDPEGNVRFCNHSPNIVGNIFSSTFEKMIETPYVKEWQNIVPDLCTDCGIYEECWGGCRAASEQLGLPLSCADPLAIEICAKKGIPYKKTKAG